MNLVSLSIRGKKGYVNSNLVRHGQRGTEPRRDAMMSAFNHSLTGTVGERMT